MGGSFRLDCCGTFKLTFLKSNDNIVVWSDAVHFERRADMGRPGYLSLYADERTQQVFDEFVKIKGISKTTALSEMMEIYMLCQDEELYTELKKKYLGVEVAKQILIQRTDIQTINDYIFIKLGTAYDLEGTPMDGEETVEAYMRAEEENELGYTWFSTQSLHFGMAKKKVSYYNQLIKSGETVTMLFAVGGEKNDICYSATVMEIVSNKDQITCPGDTVSIPEEFGENEEAKIWIKICDIRPEEKLQAAMFQVRSTDRNLKQVISNSQFHFGYVYIPEE